MTYDDIHINLIGDWPVILTLYLHTDANQLLNWYMKSPTWAIMFLFIYLAFALNLVQLIYLQSS